jgi:hypothetical protein
MLRDHGPTRYSVGAPEPARSRPLARSGAVAATLCS